MRNPSRLIEVDPVHSSYVLLALFALAGVVGGLLYWSGLLGRVLEGVGALMRAATRLGFRLWERLFSWASYPVFFVLELAALGLGGLALGTWPWVGVGLALAALFAGLTTCLAYMYIDLERYEVERGYKAIHNPLKGQELAAHLVRYGHQVGVLLLLAAGVGAVGGFALLNQGLYETVGRDWYSLGPNKATPGYADFLAYGLINLFRVVDVLDLADSYQYLRVAHVRQARWPAATLLAGFKSFFTLVLLQQIFASIRQGKVLAETITDLWSPHEPIHQRARNALPQHGVSAVGPLLESLRGLDSLTKEQRDQVPQVIAAIGPGCVGTLVGHLDDDHEHVRAVAAAALGRLRAADTLPLLVRRVQDPSELVRQSAVEALGTLGGASEGPRAPTSPGRPCRRGRWVRWVLGWRGRRRAARRVDQVGVAVRALRGALDDPGVGVRVEAARALGEVGPAASEAGPDLIELLADPDETVCCRAAEALGRVRGDLPRTVEALTGLLGSASPAVKARAARALGALGADASEAVPALAPLAQDPSEEVRRAAAEAIGAIGTLDKEAARQLTQALANPDNVVRARTAEVLGTIGEAAEGVAPALVEALVDSHDRVRAKAVEALGKIGDGAADVAVPGLVGALHDKDNWVSALAAEALGEMGESAEDAVPALVRSLRHVNPLVRANAAEALGKMGASSARAALESAAGDPDPGVRAHALRALGEVGDPATPEGLFLAALRDDDPQVRAAGVEGLGRLGRADEPAVRALLGLLEDPNDHVKDRVTRVLPKLAGARPEVVEGLCRRLEEDDSAWVRAGAAQALGRLGSAAVGAGPALLRAALTGEEGVREQAMRALALLQPPEAAEAFTQGLKDASAEVRKVASGAWRKAVAIPEGAVPALVEALRDPEVQVRAHASHALGRLEALPAGAVALLLENCADPHDGLRLNATLVLRAGPPGAVGGAMARLVGDPNARVRLVAASWLLGRDPADPKASAVVRSALGGDVPRLRQAALEVVESLGPAGEAVRAEAGGAEGGVAVGAAG